MYIKSGGKSYLFEVENGKMNMGNVVFDEYRIEDENLKFLKTASDTGYFSGDIILKSAGEYIFIQNAVDEEDYVTSCVQSLIEENDTLKEHIKALSVIVRTYLYHLIANNMYILPDSLPQWVYKGQGAVNHYVKNAVKETKGEILTYLGNPIFTSLTYCTGGYTIPYEEIYNDSLDYSVAVVDSFSASCPQFKWIIKTSTRILCNKLNIKYIDSVIVKNKTLHLLPDTIVFFGDKVTAIRGPILYQALSPLLLSPLFDITLEGDSILFEGQGKGLLVGLPIWSSREMAKRGFTYKEILEYFYPAADLVKITNNTSR